MPLRTPVRGTELSPRVRNQLRVVHMTAKNKFVFDNNTDEFQRQSMRAQILFAKSAGDIPDITKLLEMDTNGHYTDLSFYNGQEYKKYQLMKALDCSQSYTQPTNRFPPSNSVVVNESIGVNVSNPASTSLNKAIFVKSKSSKVGITMMFKNLSEGVEQMKPYLLLTSDV